MEYKDLVIWEEWVLLLGCTVHGVKCSPGIGDMTVYSSSRRHANVFSHVTLSGPIPPLAFFLFLFLKVFPQKALVSHEQI